MKKDYSVFSLAGALIWAAAVILRRFAFVNDGFLHYITDVMPNFGVIWLIVGLTITFWPYIRKADFPPKHFMPLVAIALVLVLLSEVAHEMFFSSIFDLWDMLASLAAAACLVAVNQKAKQKGDAA